MAPSKIQRALGRVKDKTSIGLAKVANTDAISDLDVAIVKATRHNEHPADEKHIREILSLTSSFRTHISVCVDTLSRRLTKTRNWTVALKSLILIHRLLTEGDSSSFQQEIFFATRRGTRLLNMSDFRDTSHPNSWDFSTFVRTFALYIDEQLEFHMHHRINALSFGDVDGDGDGDEVEANTTLVTPLHEMKIDHILATIQCLQQLLLRFLACRPIGAAKINRLVMVALYPIVKESFKIYGDITENMGVLIDRFMKLDIPDCETILEIFSQIAKQFDELDTLYSWCKMAGIARSSEYPEVERITPKKLKVMQEFIHNKSVLAQSHKENHQQPEILVQEVEVETPAKDDLTTLKALPDPESPIEVAHEEEEREVTKEEEKENKVTGDADFLNIREGAVSVEEQGDKLALELFGGKSAPTPAWESFIDDSTDWETALVQSASSLSDQKASLGGGFDILLLDGMYRRAMSVAAPSSGSASSFAFVGRTPGLLALPAPPVGGGGGEDPFAASLAVAPPAYVQMSEMEKKQQLLVEEQLMWQHHAKNLGSKPYVV